MFFVLDDLLADANVDIEADANQNGMRMQTRFGGNRWAGGARWFGHRRTGGARWFGHWWASGASVWRWASGTSWAMMRWASRFGWASGFGWTGRTSWMRWTFGTMIRMMMIMRRTRRTS